MDRFDPFVKYADVYGDIINWEKDPMNKPQNQNKYFFSDGKTYYEQICKMLRLMSVFKEAFNQIYSNEDEISEAWENFVNNLSASVVEGSEPDVTLTWTDDSVNFEFTMVPGVQGDPGVGITSISFNSDYTMTITLSDGNTYTSMSLKGETGPQGPQGETGSGLQILDVYATLADLQSAHPTGQPGDAYQVGSAGNYTLYIWSSSQSAWVPAGSLGTVSPSLSNPIMDGTASAGSQNLYSRGDHVHPTDTSRASKEELDALIKTSQSLIDQSFTYRESPTIQNGLARFDKIKGNTLVWNQLVNVNVASNFITFSDNIIKLTGTPTGTINLMSNSITHDSTHKYLFLQETLANPNNITFSLGMSSGFPWVNNAGTVGSHSSIYQSNYNTRLGLYEIANKDLTGIEMTCSIFDLSRIFGIGNEPTTIEEFTSLFTLPYYDFNEGSLLSFNGTGLKTTGKNLLDERTLRNGYFAPTDGSFVASANYRLFELYLLKGTYTISTSDTFYYLRWWDSVNHNINDNRTSYTFTLTENATVKFCMRKTDSSAFTEPFTMMVENSASASSYEPYKSSTLSLPISTYFPNGMASAKNVNNNTIVYDELTADKAVKRLEQYTFTGNETISGITNLGTYYRCYLTLPIPSKGTYATRWEKNVPNVYNYTDDNFHYYVQNSQFWYFTTASTAEAIMAELTGTKFYYDLATPTETAVDIDLDFMAYENGTEQLLPVNGSVPSTSPVIADMTYLSIDDAMDYIIDKLANVPENTQQILDSLEDDVTDLQTDVGSLQTSVSGLQTSVGNINTNIGQLSSTVAGHTSSISDMQSDISDLNTGLSNLEDTVTDNTSRIGTLESGLSATNGNVQNLSTSVSGLDSTVTAQGETVTALDSIIQDISNNPVVASLGSHELGFVAASVSATLPANTGTRVTIPKPTIFPNNYTPLFIVGMNTGSYNVSICEIPPTFGNNNSVKCWVWNNGSEQTTQITLYILCMRQRQSQ